MSWWRWEEERGKGDQRCETKLDATNRFDLRRPKRETRTTHLQPIHTPPTRLVRRILGLQHLHHQPFTRILHTLLQERLNLIRRLSIRALRERKLSLDLEEMIVEEFSSFVELFLEEGLQWERAKAKRGRDRTRSGSSRRRQESKSGRREGEGNAPLH